MKPYRYLAAFVLVLGLVAVAPAFAGQAPAADQEVPAAAVGPVATDPQPAETSQAEQEPAELSPEACVSETLPAPLHPEATVLGLGINCGNCTTCSYSGQRCSCGDVGNTCKGTCQAIGPTYTCVHACACD